MDKGCLPTARGIFVASEFKLQKCTSALVGTKPTRMLETAYTVQEFPRRELWSELSFKWRLPNLFGENAEGTLCLHTAITCARWWWWWNAQTDAGEPWEPSTCGLWSTLDNLQPAWKSLKCMRNPLQVCLQWWFLEASSTIRVILVIKQHLSLPPHF